ncbi:MAG: SlyX family protein [Polaromonas sp.]|nr:SlyX family protein [Polaromonas sp.]
MTTDAPTGRRLTALEIKASFAEDLLDELNLVVVRQQQQIEALIRELAQLREQQPDGVAGGAARLTDDLPPHY